MVNSLTTDENGSCTITEVSGELTITVTKEGYATATETLTVSKDETVNIVLEALQYGDVSFTVQDSEEQGISGARITLTNTETNETSQNGNGGTGSSGGSTISNLLYGTYSVTITCDGYEDYTGTLTVDSASSTETITLTATVNEGTG